MSDIQTKSITIVKSRVVHRCEVLTYERFQELVPENTEARWNVLLQKADVNNELVFDYISDDHDCSTPDENVINEEASMIIDESLVE